MFKIFSIPKNTLLALCFSLLYLLIFLFQKDKALTQDLGRHIKLGEVITKCLCVPKTNLFSFTEPSYPFINHHWLSEVIFYHTYIIGGIESIVFLKILLLVFSFAIVFLISSRKNSILVAVFFALLYIPIFSERIDSRPEIFSYFFLSLFLLVIDRYRVNGSRKLLFVLPLLELFWVNIHIYFIMGIIVFFLLILSEFIIKKKSINKSLFMIFILLIFASFFNPSFIQGAILPFTILQNYGYSIVENQNIFFLNTVLPSWRIMFLELMSFFLLISFLINLRKVNIFNLFISIVFVILAFYQVRNFSLFVLATFQSIVSNYSQARLSESFHKEKLLTLIMTVLSFLVVVNAIFMIRSKITSPLFGLGFLDPFKKSVDFIEKNNIKGPIFNNFDIGSYLIFRLYPKEKVFIDGRPEAYPVSFFNTYKKMQEDPNFFDKEAKSYKINTIYFAHTDITPWAQNFLSTITTNPKWITIYMDEWVIIFVRNSKENMSIINLYKKN